MRHGAWVSKLTAELDGHVRGPVEWHDLETIAPRCRWDREGVLWMALQPHGQLGGAPLHDEHKLAGGEVSPSWWFGLSGRVWLC